MKDLPASLTKENFFNVIHEHNPEGLKKFCDWIDQYKARADWNKLFNGGIEVLTIPTLLSINERGINDCTRVSKITVAPKYHELPIEIQLGIFLRFLDETSERNNFMEMLTSLMRVHLIAL